MMKTENSPRLFLKTFAVIMVAAPFLLFTVNYMIDINRVLRPDYTSRYLEMPNYRYLKTKYYLEHGDRFDGIIFGSSRLYQGFGISHMNRTLGGSWYKMEFPGGDLKEHLHIFKLLIKRKKIPKNIILTLDSFTLMREPNVTANSPQIYPYPANMQEWLGFYQLYLLRPVTIKEINALGGRQFDDRITGVTNQEGLDPRLRKTLSDLTQMEPNRNSLNTPKAQFYDLWLEIIKNFVQICGEHNIKLHVVFNTFHYKTLLARPLDKLDQFKVALAHIHPFYDFATINPLSTGNKHWLETSHYDAAVGEAMINEIQKGEQSEFWVTEKNIYDHLRTQRAHLLKSIPGLFLKDPKIYLNNDLWETEINFLSPLQRNHIVLEKPDAITGGRLKLVSRKSASVIDLNIDRPLAGSQYLLFLKSLKPSFRKVVLFADNHKIFEHVFNTQDMEHYRFIPIPASAKKLRLEVSLKPVAKESKMNMLRIIRLKKP